MKTIITNWKSISQKFTKFLFLTDIKAFDGHDIYK
jgi:hypothetical protein